MLTLTYPVAKFEDGKLLIGAEVNSADWSFIKEHQVNIIVNCTKDCDNFFENSSQPVLYKNLNLDDDCSELLPLLEVV